MTTTKPLSLPYCPCGECGLDRARWTPACQMEYGAANDEYICECDTADRAAYVVTGHDGREDVCHYCPECAALASIDWNGETKAILRVDGAR